MQRITITINDELLSELDSFVETRGYVGRSEAMRDLLRAGMQQICEQDGENSNCMAALVYVYDHSSRELSQRLTERQHDHHDLTVSTLHIHLDHDDCMEVAILRGDTLNIRDFAARLISERGVSHGRLVTIPVDVDNKKHSHDGSEAHEHGHIKVRDAPL